MRTLLLTVVLAAMLTTSAAAYDFAYIGLFTDEARSSWCTEGFAYLPFDMYVFCLPSDSGVRAVEFRLNWPANVYIITRHDLGPTVSATLGNTDTGISYSLYLCETDWFLLDIMQVLPLTSGQFVIWLQGHMDTGQISVASCLTGYPIEQALAYTSVFVNYPPGSSECTGVGTEESSWGAIKEMYND